MEFVVERRPRGLRLSVCEVEIGLEGRRRGALAVVAGEVADVGERLGVAGDLVASQVVDQDLVDDPAGAGRQDDVGHVAAPGQTMVRARRSRDITSMSARPDAHGASMPPCRDESDCAALRCDVIEAAVEVSSVQHLRRSLRDVVGSSGGAGRPVE